MFRKNPIKRGIRLVYNLRNNIINTFEKGYPLNTDKKERFLLIDLLQSRIINKMVIHERIGYYKTKLKSRKSYILIAQARLVIVFSYLFKITKDPQYKKYSELISNYIISKKNKNGIYSFHKPFWFSQDEGIATYLSILALLLVYSITNDEIYLKNAMISGDISRKILYNNKWGYVHTLNQDFWCPNSSGLAAQCYSLLYIFTQKSKYKEWMDDGLYYLIKGLKDNDIFAYSEKHPGIYITSYHALNTYFLTYFNEKKDVLNLDNTVEIYLKKAIKGLKKLIRNDGSIVEPELDYYAYINSVAASNAIFRLNYLKKEEEKTLRYLSFFFNKNDIGLYIKNNKLYNGPYKYFKDVLETEILFWLIIGKGL